MFIHLFIKDQKEMKRRIFGFRFIETIVSFRVVDSATYITFGNKIYNLWNYIMKLIPKMNEILIENKSYSKKRFFQQFI